MGRARGCGRHRGGRGADVHAVVYQNVEPAFLAELTAISDPLWVEPK